MLGDEVLKKKICCASYNRSCGIFTATSVQTHGVQANDRRRQPPTIYKGCSPVTFARKMEGCTKSCCGWQIKSSAVSGAKKRLREVFGSGYASSGGGRIRSDCMAGEMFGLETCQTQEIPPQGTSRTCLLVLRYELPGTYLVSRFDGVSSTQPIPTTRRKDGRNYVR